MVHDLEIKIVSRHFCNFLEKKKKKIPHMRDLGIWAHTV